MKVIRLLLSLIFLALCAWLVYLLIHTIKDPIAFDEVSQVRKDAAIERLKDVRISQIAFRSKKSHYTNNMDSLIQFILTDSMEVEKIIGDPNDTTVVVKREIIKIPFIDTLFSGNKARVKAMKFVPFRENQILWKMDTATVVKNEIPIPAFEASTRYTSLYKGLKPKFYKELWNEEIKVGSINDGTTNGNWGEK